MVQPGGHAPADQKRDQVVNERHHHFFLLLFDDLPMMVRFFEELLRGLLSL
jgi:hypothetical protein